MTEHVQPLSVFISYARADRPAVERLAIALEARGIAVWWDKMIEGGAAFAREIEERLESADAVVAVWSKTSVESDWVRDEAGHGRDRKRLVPVSLDGTAPPLGFRQYHAISLKDWRGDGDAPVVAEILRGIAAAAGTSEPSASALIGATSRGAGFNRRKAILAGGGAVVVTAASLAWWKGLIGPEVRNSVAVMPFKNLSGDDGQAYFSDGLSEEIRTTLARNSALQVAAPASVAEVVAKPDDAKTIGSKLGVSYLLEGSVRRAGNVARIAAELIDTSTGFSRWSQSFDRDLGNIFAVQTEIANVVAEALSLRVTKLEPQAGGTRNVEAYEAYLRGLALFRSDKNEQSDRDALTQLVRALELDPGFTLARAYLARVQIVLAALYVTSAEAGALFDKALADASQAVKEAPGVAHAQMALGLATMYGKRRFAEARPAFEESYRLAGGDANIIIPYALFSSYFGNSEAAIAATAKAMRLDPLNSGAFRYAGLAMFYGRRFDEAVGLFRKAIAIKPDARQCHGLIGLIRILQEDLAEAGREFAQEPNEQLRAVGQSIVAFKQGRKDEAQRVLDAGTAELGDNASYDRARVFAQTGRLDEALSALERGYVARDGGIASLKVDPMLDPLRTNPRFSRLLSQLDLG